MKQNLIVILFSCFYAQLSLASALVQIEPGHLFTITIKDGAITFSNLSEQNLYIQAPENMGPRGIWLPDKVNEKYILTVKPKYGPPKTSEITFKKLLTEIPEFLYDLKYSTNSFLDERLFKKFDSEELGRYISLQDGVLRMTAQHDLSIFYVNSFLTIPGGFDSEVPIDTIASKLGWKRKLDLSEFKVFKEDDGSQNCVSPEEIKISSHSKEKITYSESLPSELTFYLNGEEISEEDLPSYIEVSHGSDYTNYKNIGLETVRPRVARKLGRCSVHWDNDLNPGQILVDKGHCFSRTSAGF